MHGVQSYVAFGSAWGGKRWKSPYGKEHAVSDLEAEQLLAAKGDALIRPEALDYFSKYADPQEDAPDGGRDPETPS
jgi:hypothetical protein